MKNGWIVMLALVTASGCWSREEVEADPPEEEARAPSASTPAVRARQELLQLGARLRALPPAREAGVKQAAALLATQEPDTHAAVALAHTLSQALREDPALAAAGPLAAANPAIAQRLATLNAALDAHIGLLDQLSISAGPSAGSSAGSSPAPNPDAPPAPETVEAAVLLEKATGGQWPISRIFVAYSLELESLRQEATRLVEACEAAPAAGAATCSAEDAERARALIASVEHLSALIDEFASIYC